MFLNRILVPCDFLEESFTALIHAARLAKKTDAEIILLHFTESTFALGVAESKINIWKARLADYYGGNIRTIVQQGNIIEGIGITSKKENCQLVIMPTHGMKGAQEITGSLALSVVSESETPFIIVQQKEIRKHGYKKIVIPVEYRQELVDEGSIFVEIAKLFDAEIFFIANNSAKNNNVGVMNAIQKKFSDANIRTNSIESGKFDFSKAAADYAVSIDADLICAMNFAYENLYSLYPRTDEEDLIYNKGQIPVMLVTPKQKEDDRIHLPFSE